MRGYQVLVFDALAGEGPFEFNVTVEADVTSLTVPADFLQPDIFYSIEVLAIEESRNQTITEAWLRTFLDPGDCADD